MLLELTDFAKGSQRAAASGSPDLAAALKAITPLVLQASLDAYARIGKRAPVVFGGLYDDDEAEGWVDQLLLRGNKLMAEVTFLSPRVAAIVAKLPPGDITPMYFTPQARGNPAPGTWYLKRVAVKTSAKAALKPAGPVFAEPTTGGAHSGPVTEDVLAVRAAQLRRDENALLDRAAALVPPPFLPPGQVHDPEQLAAYKRATAYRQLFDPSVSFLEAVSRSADMGGR